MCGGTDKTHCYRRSSFTPFKSNFLIELDFHMAFIVCFNSDTKKYQQKQTVTVEQCCQYLGLRDYPILVNQTLKERFKDKRKFDVFATPLLKIANPRAHPLILSTLLRAKWYEVMNTETGGASSRV